MDLNKMRCKNCVYYNGLYIHPWSKGIPEELKRSREGFTCTGFADLKDEPSWIDVFIGIEDGIGCEMFKERTDGTEKCFK